MTAAGIDHWTHSPAQARRALRQPVAAALALLLLALMIVMSAPAIAADGPARPNFDHFATGFPLLGAHSSVNCDSCHGRGAFKGTPTQCAGCHNGSTAVGKGRDHFPTNAPCETCHTERGASFDVVSGFDHAGITTGCNSCHQQDKPANHLPTPSNAECVLCHSTPPFTFESAPAFNHTNVSGLRCDGCHSGNFANFGAIGKIADHPLTESGLDCNACHTTSTFSMMRGAGGGFDHSNVVTGCNNCHLKDKLASHIPIPANAECVLCHRMPPDLFSQAATFNHGNVRSLRCDACHNGAFAAAGAPGKTSTHPLIQPGQDCGACHSTASFANASFDHTSTTTGCSNCHVSDLPTNHIPRPTNSECILCHAVAPELFSTAATFSHTQVSLMRCDSCHGGAFVTSGALGKTPAHPATQAGQDCNACHNNTTSFAGAAFNHTGVTTGCNTCHLDDKPAMHIPVPAGAECILCHKVAPEPFTQATNFNHNNVSAIRCDACHGGMFVPMGLMSKTPTHPPVQAGQDCNACHTSTAAFASVVFNHSGVTTGCNGCHLTDKPASHIPVPAGSECLLCHRVSPDLFTTAATFSHSNVSTLRCDTCHNGAFNGAGAIGKTPSHPTTQAGQDCNVCHTNTVSFAGATFNHTGVSSGCNSCHLTDKPASHIPVPAGSECVLCHRVSPDPFAIAATFNHSNVSTMRCDACHSGAFNGAGAIGKSSGHVATQAGQDCNACHTNTVSFAGATFNHTGVSTGCNSCHLTDKPASHLPVPAGSECVLCHRVPPDTFTIAATFNHSKVSTMRCDACHSGAYTGYGASGKSSGHPATTAGQDCNACHTNTVSFAGATFNHAGVTTGCNSCHLSDKPANHLPVPAGSECVLCHRVPPDTFTIASTFNHSKVTAMRCDACHSGAYVGYGASGKSSGHPATTAGQDCDACHLNTTSFSGAGFNHTGVTTGCNSCHLTDKPANHLPVPAGSECYLCHRVPPDSFANAGNYSHSKVTSMRCDSCHNGQYTGYGAEGKPGDHPSYTAGKDCNASGCHNTSNWD